MLLTLLDRTIIRQTALTTLVVSLIVTSVIWLTQALRLLELVVDRGAPISMLLYMLLLTVPTFLSMILPLGLCVAVLFVIYKLMMDSELVVMRAIGMSHLRLTRPIAVVALAVLIISYSLTLWVAPHANSELARQEFIAKNDYALVLLRDGSFNKLTDNITVYVRERIGMKEVRGLILHDESKPDKTDTMIAEKGVLVDSADGARVVLLNGIRQERDRATGALSELKFKQYALDLSQFGPDFDARRANPREITTLDLLMQSQATASDDDLYYARQVAELHGRLATPWLAMSYSILAMALLMTAVINRRGMAPRLVVAGVVVILWQVAVLASVNLIPKYPEFTYMLYALVLMPLPYLVLTLWRGRWFLPGDRQ